MKSHAERAIELAPTNDLAWHLLGRWHQAMAEVGPMLRGLVKLAYGGLPAASIEESISCLRKAVSLNPNRVAHQIELGRSLALAGKRDDALAALERGLTLPNRERDDPGTKARGRETLANLN
jgi:tetratricopeptide (TPR) repeat protein